MNHVNVTGNALDYYFESYELLICSLRPSRIKAKDLAVAEMLFVLRGIDCMYITNGPGSDKKGLIPFFIMKNSQEFLKEALRKVGYCNKFFLLEALPKDCRGVYGNHNKEKIIIWKGKSFYPRLFYEQSQSTYEKHSARNREFFIYSKDGNVKRVEGYRGDGSPMGRRALPVEDSRLLVNLSDPFRAEVLMDPFAGSGGILYEARYINPSLFLISADIDDVVEPGLMNFSDRHYTLDARKVKLEKNLLDAIVTEVPFNRKATKMVSESFMHLYRFMKKDGRIIFMCADYQYKFLKETMEIMNLTCFIESPVDRKGMPVVIAAWYLK